MASRAGSRSDSHCTDRRATPLRTGHARRLARALAAVAALPALAPAAQAAWQLSSVALAGDPAPGTGGGTYAGFGTAPPAPSNAGHVAFLAGVSGGSASSGIFVDDGGASQAQVVLAGDSAPGTGGATYSTLDPPSVNSAGFVVFRALLTGGSVSDGIFLSYAAPGPVTPLVLAGDSAPGTGGGSFASFDSVVAINDLGEVAFQASISGGTTSEGIFLVSGGTVTALAVLGDTAPGTGGGTYFDFLGGQELSLSDAGEVSFVATVSGGSAATGLFTETTSTSRVVALLGDTAPGTGGGTYSALGLQVIPDAGIYPVNASGDVAFAATVTGGSVTYGIFLDSGGTDTALVLEGDAAPGGGTFAFPGFFLGLESLNAAGELAFAPTISGGSVATGVFLRTGGAPMPIALAGDSVPGSIGTFTSFSFPSATDGSDVVFLAGFTGSGEGIFRTVLDAGGPSPSASGFAYREVGGTGTPIPGGSGSFDPFQQINPCFDRRVVAFHGVGPFAQEGIYRDAAGSLDAVVDTSHEVPGSAGTEFFERFPGSVLDAGWILFHGLGDAGHDGIHRIDATEIIGPCFLVADTGTAIPGGVGTFTGFGGLGLDGTLAAFVGEGAAQQGVYAERDGTLEVVADLSTPIPDGTGSFTVFEETEPCFLEGVVAFLGYGSSGQTGIYAHDGSTLSTRVDTATLVPGGSGSSFVAFASTSLDAGQLAFRGTGSGGEQGVYVAQGTNPPVAVADLSTAIPDAGGKTFTGFGNVSLHAGRVAFVGYGSKAIYTDAGGPLRKVVGVGDTLDGRTVVDVSMGRGALGARGVAFWAAFADDSEGMFTATLPVQVPALSRGGLALLALGVIAAARAAIGRSRRKHLFPSES